MAKALSRLAERQREILLLHDLQGFTHTEIGVLLGIEEDTSKSQLFHARRLPARSSTEATMSDEMTADERALFDRLRDATPPTPLEERIVASLESRGLLRRPPRRINRRVLATAIVATIAGFVGGVWFERPRPATEPRWVLLLYSPPGRVDPSAGAEEDRVREYSAWAKALRSRGVHIAGEKLGDGRDRLGPIFPDGDLGGWFVVEGQDRQGALQIARSCLHLRHGGTIFSARWAVEAFSASFATSDCPTVRAARRPSRAPLDSLRPFCSGQFRLYR